MKKITIFSILSAVLFSSLSFAKPTYPEKVTFLGKELVGKHIQGVDGETIAEYIPAKETLEKYHLMFAIRYQDLKITAQQMQQGLGKQIEKRKAEGKDPIANYSLFEKDKNYAVDFVISVNDVIEHNIFVYFDYENALGSYQLVRRIYTKEKGVSAEDERKFIKEILDNRSKYLAELTRADLPKPSKN